MAYVNNQQNQPHPFGAKDYAILFFIGWFMAMLVASQTKSVVGNHFIGAGILSFCIGMNWFFGIKRASVGPVWAGVCYAIGGVTGTYTGMLITALSYGH
jgi:hypothetical protein